MQFQTNHSPANKIIITHGDRHGKLTIVNEVEPRLRADRNGSKRMVICICDCGKTTKPIVLDNLRNGHTTSCGCVYINSVRTINVTHGMTGTPEYRAFKKAQSRCNNPKDNRYNTYGARGIKFLFASFEEFYADVGQRPTSKYSIDRIDNDGHYAPGNMKWSTASEQSNNKTTCKPITIDGVTKNVSQWLNDYGTNESTYLLRVKRGWCRQCAITIKPHGGVCVHR